MSGPTDLDIKMTKLGETLRGIFEEARHEALQVDQLHYGVRSKGELPMFTFNTSQGLVTWTPPGWEVLTQLARDLINYRIDHDKALKDPMREFEQSIAENNPRRSRKVRPQPD
jgi:hypothetical protein